MFDPNCPKCGAHDYGLFRASMVGCPHCLRADNERLRGLLREIRRDYMVALDSFNVLRDMGVTPTERGVRMDEVRRRIARIDVALGVQGDATHE